MEPIMRFYTPETGHNPLSNFSAHPVHIGGVDWLTVEHYYQAMKSEHPGIREEIRRAPTPGKAKKLGRGVTLRDDWEAIKLLVMRQALDRKFTLGAPAADFLLDTGDALLVEGNDWGDRFWGVDGTGQNWLGHLLMARRAELRSAAQGDSLCGQAVVMGGVGCRYGRGHTGLHWNGRDSW